MILCDDFILISQFIYVFSKHNACRSDKEEEDFEEELCENAVTFLHFDVFCQFLYIAYMVAPKSWLYDLQCPCKYILDIRICYVQALESCKIITFSTRARGIQHHWIKRKLQAFV